MEDYVQGQFSDVSEPDWYARYVEDAYNFGFFRGLNTDNFKPDSFLTFSESLELVARLSRTYGMGSERGKVVDSAYALEHGIIESRNDISLPANRLQFARLICAALPKEAFPEINSIPDYGICDVVSGMGFEDNIYLLYRAGIFCGTDQYGTFSPEKSITRAEACAMLVRIIDPLARIKAVPPKSIPAVVLYQRCMDAVFLLETFDADGESIRTGTGFFINDTGSAVTNLHVLDNAASAEVTLSSGDICPVSGVVAFSDEHNLAIFSVDLSGVAPGSSGAGSQLMPGKNYLKLSDSDLAVAGSAVYALGNPLAYVHTITDGIVANTYREVDGDIFFQFTAPISFGSGGSPVLNALGQVVGVASSSFTYGQNLNLAVPANFIKELEPGVCIPLDELLESRAATTETVEDTEDIDDTEDTEDID